jgi:hypothetical protein
MLSQLNTALIIIQTSAHVTGVTRAAIRIIYAIFKQASIPKSLLSCGSVAEETQDMQDDLLTESGEVTL